MDVDGNADLRVNWRANWLRSIEEVANLEMQRTTWLNPENGNPHYTFVEYACCYFDDLALNKIEGGYSARIVEGLLSVEEAHAVKYFHAIFEQYRASRYNDSDHEAILADDGWYKVVESAKDARVRLAPLINNSSELQILFEPSDYARLASK